jgi:hypothetical protein
LIGLGVVLLIVGIIITMNSTGHHGGEHGEAATAAAAGEHGVSWVNRLLSNFG